MSDCSPNAWRRPAWGATEWHAPSGSVVHVTELPCMVSVVFADGSRRDTPITLAGRQVDHVEVDGVVYRKEDTSGDDAVGDDR